MRGEAHVGSSCAVGSTREEIGGQNFVGKCRFEVFGRSLRLRSERELLLLRGEWTDGWVRHPGVCNKGGITSDYDGPREGSAA